MVVLDVEAIDFTMVPAFLFAKVILAVGLLQFGVSPIFFVLQDAEERAGIPFAAGHGWHAISFNCLAMTKLPDYCLELTALVKQLP